MVNTAKLHHMNIYKKLFLALIISLVVYFAYFHIKVAAASKQVPIRSDYKIKIIHEVTPNTIKNEIKEVFGKNWEIAYAVMMSEGKENTKAKHFNSDKRKTHDRGLFQINSFWHSEVSDECAYDMKCNIRQAYRISKRGNNWNEWYGYKNGVYLKYLTK